MIKTIIIAISLVLITSFCYAESYTGKAINLETNDRGIEFTVIVTADSTGEEVFRANQWVSTGVMTGDDAVQAVKNVVDRMTMDLYAQLEGAKDAMKEKDKLEKYRGKCNKFIETKDRPSPQTPRIP